MEEDGKRMYQPDQIEQKWQDKWIEDKVYSPDLDKAQEPFYNLMMFPYPSAEGLHVGNMYAFTGADIYARFNRMQQKDVFEPIGLDGFGIHSENYALKIGKHPMDQAKVSEANFYRQLKSIGNSFDWTRTLATYDPQYYKWTQWIFTQMFKNGLAVRKRAPVNFCPSCKTVLSDEQVIDEKCERCGSTVEKRDLEQWFFKITNYAERLLNNISSLDWAEKVKVAQKNWIGKSEGARVKFRLADTVKRIVILHGRNGSPDSYVFPWLKKELEKMGYIIEVPKLPNTDEPNDEEQADYVQKHCKLDESTAIVGQSMGGIVAMRLLERGVKVQRVVLACVPFSGKFNDHKVRKSVTEACQKGFDFSKIRENAESFIVIRDEKDEIVPREDAESWQKNLNGVLLKGYGNVPHFSGDEEPDFLKAIVPVVEVFTTRPDTLYGATFLVLSPEHPVVNQLLEEKSIPEEKISNIKSQISNKEQNTTIEEVQKYVDEAKKKTEQERLSEGKEKTGVFSGKYAVNPVNNKEMPVWIADYVLMGYGTGAIMAVPAHDARDFEFAKKFDLPIKQVIAQTGPGAPSSRSTASSASEVQALNGTPSGRATRSEMTQAYTGPGVLTNSGEWDGIKVPDEMEKVIESLEKREIGKREVTYHLRDWLISRQRYWGPPIPMIYCENCAKKGLSWFDTEEAKKIQNSEFKIQNSKDVAGWPAGLASESVAGWYPVEVDQLPVELPHIEDYKPLGTRSTRSAGASARRASSEQAGSDMVKGPLDNHPEFYETTCPGCGGKATRETDVSDTFLDSSWYLFRYLATEVQDSAFSDIRNKKWLPVNVYIGGAEHSVLHLLYARFVTMVFKDLGYIDFEEPFSRFFAHGLIIKEGAKMSKSKGNVVVPDEYIKKYGADTLRLYLMFLGPFKDGGDFSDSGIEGSYRFVKRVWNLFMNSLELVGSDDEATLKMISKTIKEVTQDLEDFSYNTAIARLMEMYNFVSAKEDTCLSRETALSFLKLLAPFTPHLAEEVYQALFVRDEGEEIREKFKSIHLEQWPKHKEEHLVESEVTIVIQVNGKRRGEIRVENSESKIQNLVEEKAEKQVVKYLEGKTVKKTVFVPGRIVNFVV